MEMTFPVAPPARRCAPASGRCHYCLRPEGSIHILVYRTDSGLRLDLSLSVTDSCRVGHDQPYGTPDTGTDHLFPFPLARGSSQNMNRTAARHGLQALIVWTAPDLSPITAETSRRIVTTD